MKSSDLDIKLTYSNTAINYPHPIPSEKIPWSRRGQPAPAFLPGISQNPRGFWWATVHGVTKSQTWLSN